MKTAFIDLEVDGRGKILDIGGVKAGQGFHSARIPEFAGFVSDCGCLCGHNIIEHDIKYLNHSLERNMSLSIPFISRRCFSRRSLTINFSRTTRSLRKS